jgi:hypothetical protein
LVDAGINARLPRDFYFLASQNAIIELNIDENNDLLEQSISIIN